MIINILSYEVVQQDSKFATVCKTDGYWSITWLSKNKKRAHVKGQEFMNGTRTSMRKYVTAYGRMLNEEKSRRIKT
jgi:hypothetical protein